LGYVMVAVMILCLFLVYRVRSVVIKKMEKSEGQKPEGREQIAA